MRKTCKFNQRIEGAIKAIVLMPTYGTAAWLYKEMIGLPKTISINGDESLLHFRKRVQGEQVALEIKLRKLVGTGNIGIWQKEILSKVNFVKHDYIQTN